jgi:hypothetical protein
MALFNWIHSGWAASKRLGALVITADVIAASGRKAELAT